MASDEEDEADEPVVELGDGPAVTGAPVGRVASRLSWPRSKSDVIEQAGSTELRTPEGPQPLAELLADVDTNYFASRRAFVGAVRDVIGYEPVATDE